MFRVPVATYRLQFNAQFTFADARAIVGYLAGIGMSDLYASPLLRPRKGSSHGYDIVDANALNPELGTHDDLIALHQAMQERSMGMLLDIVPNHMAASHENAWWVSVLENGPQSRYLHFFDIDWRPVLTHAGVVDKVLLPVLGRPYGEALEDQEIQLAFDAEGFYFAYYDKRLPLAPQSYSMVLRECVDQLPAEGVGIELRDLVQNDSVVANSRFLKDTLWRIHEQSPEFREALAAAIVRLNGEKGNVETFNALDALLDAQWYRLAYWRIASETINYRRFFDVTDLVGLRVENPEVFEARNRSTLDLINEGVVTGVRIDHIDGLFDPVGYLAKLQLRLGDPASEAHQQFYVVVEKILQHGEALPASFRVAGTTGYDFIDCANALLVDPGGLRTLTSLYERFTGLRQSWQEVVYERKKQVIEQLFSGEMRALGTHLGALAMADRNARDFAPSELLIALMEVTACLSVYRTYVREVPGSEGDREFLCAAIREARIRAGHTVDPLLFDFVESVLLVAPPSYIAAEQDKWLEFVMRWQQFTGRVTAKGVEDTAFYNYNRLVSLNEVGAEPGLPADFDGVSKLHQRNLTIAAHWPNTMNTTSTHDTKRGEDVRARIHVLSEIAEEWQRAVGRWSKANQSFKRDGAPSPNDELLIYQTMVGIWPFGDDPSELEPRLLQYLEKAVREAKTHSSWIAIDEPYEAALRGFASAILRHEPFRNSFLRLQKKTAFHGFLNSLSQVVLKICSPGVPDFYQGTELWDFSLVDPDNRRPVDYPKRQELFGRLDSVPLQALLKKWQDGRVKLFLTARALAARARHIDVFRGGEYSPVETGTPHAVAFRRGEEVLVVIPRLTARLAPMRLPVGEVWGENRLSAGGIWQNVFTGERVEGERLPLRDVLATFPVAILERA